MNEKAVDIMEYVNGESLRPIAMDENGYVALEGKLENLDALCAENKIALSGDSEESDVEICITEDTFISVASEKSEDIYILTHIKNDTCVADLIVSALFDASFEKYEIGSDKMSVLLWFNALPMSQKNSIMSQISGSCNRPAKDQSVGKLRGYKNLLNKYNLLKATYRPQQQADIDGLFEEAKPGLGHAHTVQSKAERKLDYILNIDSTHKTECSLNKEEIISLLDSKLYKLTKVKNKIAETIISGRHSKTQGTAILLVGGPGTGKTSVAQAIADVLSMPSGIIPIGSITSVIDVAGAASQYDGSDCGEVVKMFYKHGRTDIVLILDEIDKSSELKEGTPIKAFNDILSETHYFKDAFLTTYIDTSNTVVIATANSTETIPANILDRFTVINIDSYSDEDRVEIAKGYIIPFCLSEYGISPRKIVFEDAAIRHIASDYCSDDGARDMKRFVYDIVRHILSEGDITSKNLVKVTCGMVDSILSEQVLPNSPAIVYRRNRQFYSKDTAAEIESLITKLRRNDLQPQEREKANKKLKYLTTLIPLGNAFSEFDVDRFYEYVNESHFGLDDVKDSIAKILYTKTMQDKSLSSVRLLLVGPPGVGKSSIVKAIANACNAKYQKISLNGINDERVLKGHSYSYQDADAGILVKGAERVGTTKAVFQLDEIDKLGSESGSSTANALIDLLDDSSEFTDAFLSVPTDFSEAMFIATANSLSDIPQLLCDRFTVIEINGYTAEEKVKIVKDYAFPKIIKSYSRNGLAVELADSAAEVLVNDYCLSSGVRDAEHALTKIIRDKLFESRHAPLEKIVISEADIEKSMGAKPIPRGNYPEVVQPGLAMGLAVTGDNKGMSFAVETVILESDNSSVITGLPSECTSDSVKIAKTFLQENFQCSLKSKGYHLHFGEGSVEKDGPSAGVAIAVSMLSAALNTPVSGRYSYTGEIDLFGNVFAVGGVEQKIQAAIKAGCSKVFIPYENYLRSEKIGQFKNIEVVPIKHLYEVIAVALPDAISINERKFKLPMIR